MSAIVKQVVRARRRLRGNLLLDHGALGTAVAASAWSLALLVERLFGLDLPLLAGAAAAAALAAAIARFRTYRAGVDRLRAAIALDGAAGLKERLSTALTCGQRRDPFVRAALADAERTAGRLRVAAHLPLRAPRRWPWSLASLLAALILYAFLPVFDILASGQRPEQRQAAAVERQEVQAALNERFSRIRQLARKSPLLRDLAQDLAPLRLPDEPTATPADIRREAVKRIDKVADQLARQQAKFDSLKQLKRALARLDRQSGDDAAARLARALAAGDLDGARRALSELSGKLAEAARSEDPAARRRLARLQKKLDRLAGQLRRLAESSGLERELQRKAGLSEGQARRLLEQLRGTDPRQLEKELQRLLADKRLTQQQIRQLAKKIADRKAALQRCRGLGDSLARAAAAMQQCDGPNGSAAAADAAAALGDAAGQLSQLEAAQQLADELEAELADLGSCRAGVCQGSFARPAGPISGKVGPQGPDAGLGYGARIGKERAAHQYRATKVGSEMRGGQIIGQFLIDAPQIKGQAAAEARQAVNAARRDATDAVERNAIPRQYDHVLKTYFEHLAGLVGAGRQAAETDTSGPRHQRPVP